MTYEELILNYENEVDIYEHPLMENPIVKKKKGKGFYYCGDSNESRGVIFIEKSLSNRDKKCVLAEEIGHHHTSTGNILNLNNHFKVKQERWAREWGARKLINYNEFKRAIKIHDSIYEVAEELEVNCDLLVTYVKMLKRNSLDHNSCKL